MEIIELYKNGAGKKDVSIIVKFSKKVK